MQRQVRLAPMVAKCAGPRLAGPRVAGPRLAGPRVAGPRAAGPRVAGPRVAGPRAAGPRVALGGPAGPRPAQASFLRFFGHHAIKVVTLIFIQTQFELSRITGPEVMDHHSKKTSGQPMSPWSVHLQKSTNTWLQAVTRTKRQGSWFKLLGTDQKHPVQPTLAYVPQPLTTWDIFIYLYQIPNAIPHEMAQPWFQPAGSFQMVPKYLSPLHHSSVKPLLILFSNQPIKKRTSPRTMAPAMLKGLVGKVCCSESLTISHRATEGPSEPQGSTPMIIRSSILIRSVWCFSLI